MNSVATETQVLEHGFCRWRTGRWGLLTVPTDHCFSILGSHGHPKSEKERRQLCFRLEDELFFDAEEIAFDLLAAGDHQIAIVVKKSELNDALAQCDSTLAVVPESLLLLQGIRSGFAPSSKVSLSNGERQVLLLRRDQWTEYLEWDRSNLHRWSIHDSAEASSLVDQCSSGPDSKVAAIWSIETTKDKGLTQLGQPGDSVNGTRVHPVKHSEYHDLLTKTVHEIVSGKQPPILNLRCNGDKSTDPLAPAMPALGLAIAASFFLLVTVASAFVYRGWSYRKRAELLASKQAEVFTELFPGQRVPVGLTGRIESEYRRLKATRSESQVLDATALPVLYQFMASAPDEFRFQVQRVEFATNELTRVEGLVEGLRELELLRESFEAAGFRLPPLRAEQVSGGVIINWANVAWKATPKPLNDEDAESPSTASSVAVNTAEMEASNE
ncbi:MAG: hypothetical protein AAGG44_13145 [Planctomycetota bacterium]